jgi:hypothetical protein
MPIQHNVNHVQFWILQSLLIRVASAYLLLARTGGAVKIL